MRLRTSDGFLIIHSIADFTQVVVHMIIIIKSSARERAGRCASHRHRDLRTPFFPIHCAEKVGGRLQLALARTLSKMLAAEECGSGSKLASGGSLLWWWRVTGIKGQCAPYVSHTTSSCEAAASLAMSGLGSKKGFACSPAKTVAISSLLCLRSLSSSSFCSISRFLR